MFFKQKFYLKTKSLFKMCLKIKRVFIYLLPKIYNFFIRYLLLIPVIALFSISNNSIQCKCSELQTGSIFFYLENYEQNINDWIIT